MPKDKKITVTDFFALSNCLFTPLKISGKKAIPGKYLWDSNSVEVMRQCKVCGDQRKCHGDQIPMIRLSILKLSKFRKGLSLLFLYYLSLSLSSIIS